MTFTYVHTKTIGADLNITQPLPLRDGEVVASVVVGAAAPTTTPPVSVVMLNTSPLILAVSGGAPGVTYGFPVTVVTNQRSFVVSIAVVSADSDLNPYRNEDPGSFQDLIDDLDAGKSAIGTAYFQFDPEEDLAGGYVTWDVIDNQGVVYAAGNAFEYTIKQSAVNVIVIARAVVNVPSDIPPTVDDPYQLRYTLRFGEKTAYHYEALKVRGFPDMQVGTQDNIEMQGDVATLSLVTEQLYANYTLEIYQNNKKIATMNCTGADRVARGYFVAGSIDTSALAVSLIPYQVVWKFWNNPAQAYREASALWVVNASLIQAIEDVKSKVNKARHTLYGTADSQFPSTEIMKWLRRAGDAFNGAYGVITAFTFTNAMGGIREFWLMYAEKYALEAQYLLEAEKAFNFSGAAISLDVDRTGFLDSAASKLQGVLDNEVKPFKQNLIHKGATSGDGSGGVTDGTGGLNRAGRIAAVGVLITPASLHNGYRTVSSR